MMMSFPLLWHHMLDGSTCEFCPKSYQCPCLDYRLWIPWTLLIGLGCLQSCCQIWFLKQRKVTRSMILVLCVPRSSHKPTANWEYIDPIYNRFLGSQFSVEAVSGEIRRGKNGVDGLLDFLEWFTKYQALDKCLYQGKLALLSEAMRKISPEAFDLSLSRGQSLNPFMATLSSGATSSQQQSMLPPLPQQWSPHPQQWSASPPLLQQWSAPPPPLQQQSAFLPHQWSVLPP